VWKRRDGEQRICLGAINTELSKVWVNGFTEYTEQIVTFEYLNDNFELEAGWSI
jgi:hypothetical protein